MATHETLAENVEEEFEDRRTLGEFLSDRLASFGGSWTFIIAFAIVLMVWTAFNLVVPEAERFDPYPYILLNLFLSMLAALQAPIIMMSQKRQEAKDRLRSQSDYRVSLKAELEIRHLHEKMDHLISRQWQRLAEIPDAARDHARVGRPAPPVRPPARARGSITSRCAASRAACRSAGTS